MSKATADPDRKGWKCLWETCGCRGMTFYPPPGITVDEDIQHHHRTVHGVQPDRPGIHFPEKEERVPGPGRAA